MDTLLTLVIAVGGIATGIGAIWTAMVARRQAQATERSLSEQTERSHLTFEMDMLSRLEERWDSPHFASRRRKAATYILNNAFVEDDSVVMEVRRLPRSAWDVCNFYETLGGQQRVGALQTDPVWNTFGTLARTYWTLCEPAIKNLRQEWENPVYFEDFERLIQLGTEIHRAHGVGDPAREQLYGLMEHEAVVGEEASTGEDPVSP